MHIPACTLCRHISIRLCIYVLCRSHSPPSTSCIFCIAFVSPLLQLDDTPHIDNIFFEALYTFIIMLSGIYPHAVFASTSQSVFAAVTAIAKLTLVFPLFAFGTAFLLNTVNGSMALLIS